MQMLDTSILNSAIPAIARDLNENALSMHWVVISYTLAVGVLMPVSGWIADYFGMRVVLVAAIALFSLGSLLCAASFSLPMLIASRVVQGIGGAFMVPVGRLLVLRVYPRKRLVEVLSFITVPGLIGPLLGPAVGGFLVEYATWHWIFLINLPVGLLGGLAVWHYIPNLKQSKVSHFDYSGFLLFGVAIVLLTLALDSAGEQGQSHVSGWKLGLSGAVGAACLALYWLHARNAAEPLFSLALFRIRSFSVGILGNIFTRLASSGMPFLTPLLLQVVIGYPPFQAGLIMIPMTITSIFSKAIAPPLLKRFGYRWVLFVNTLLLGTAIASFSLMASGMSLVSILLFFAAFGAINSLQFTAINTLALIDLPPDLAGSGNSLVSVVMQLSVSLGVALAASLLTIFSIGQSTPSAGLAGVFYHTYLCMGGISVIAALLFLFIRRESGRED